ncbi:DUF4198 domain-containing protein [Oceanobacillus halotolerans]|uniref:DUF4198 domain-containing protein n=1 Tax=Oceanobacillus halotolerans TaxID=2663380 RepID=UPI0013D99539|nr:DUF4198 domain-containing protein [Oceanobacillus halotolerans]
MKRKLLFGIAFLCFFFIWTPAIAAHELYIEVEEFTDQEELRVDVLWGHIRDYVSEAEIEDYQLHVRYPSGDTEQLPLEAVGVHARAYVPIIEEGDYTFWATREASTYTPEEEDITQLSLQTAKTIYQTGDNNTNADQAIDADFEIIPTSDISDFTTGTFEGVVYLDGEPSANASITAYGPNHEVLEGLTNEEGHFEFTFDSAGKWLLKSDLTLEEDGTLGEEAYEVTSHTSTLLVDTSIEQTENETNLIAMFAMLVVGLLFGASVAMFILKLKGKTS